MSETPVAPIRIRPIHAGLGTSHTQPVHLARALRRGDPQSRLRQRLRASKMKSEGNLMRLLQLGALVLACMMTVAVQTSSGQSSSPQPTTRSPKDATKKQAGKSVTLIGCVGSDEAAAGQFTFSDISEGTTYRLSGTDVREYSGRRVQIVGTHGSARLHITGGLVPSPNAAAQAGALDPARSAREAASGAGAPPEFAQLPEFRVKRVQPASGACP